MPSPRLLRPLRFLTTRKLMAQLQLHEHENQLAKSIGGAFTPATYTLSTSCARCSYVGRAHGPLLCERLHNDLLKLLVHY